MNMDFRLSVIVCIVASASCLKLDAKSHAIFDNCPVVSGPSIVKHLDFDNSGVERLVVYFYKAKNSQQIVPFIPSREYQECIQDITEEAGEVVHRQYKSITVEELFNNPVKTMRYKIKRPVMIPESPLDIWPQPWNKYHIQHGSHEIANTHETGHDISLDFPEHDVLPNDPSVVYDIDADKKPDWHIPVQELDDHKLPWRPISLPGEIDYSSSSIEHHQPDDSSGLIINGHIMPPMIRPNQHSFIRPGKLPMPVLPVIRPIGENFINKPYPDNLKPIMEDIEAPLIRPNQHPFIEPIRPGKLPMPVPPVIKPIEDIFNKPYPDNLKPIIKEEIEAPVIRPNQHPFTEPIRPGKLPMPVPPVLKPIEDIFINKPYPDNLKPIIKEEIEAPVIRPNQHPFIEPIRPGKLPMPLPPVIRPIEENFINKPYPDNLKPIIKEEIEAPVIRPNQHPFIEPIRPGKLPMPLPPVIRPIEENFINKPYPDNLTPIIKEEIYAPVIRPINNNIIIGPNRPHDQYRPVIRDEIEAPVIRPMDDNLIIRPLHPGEKLLPIIKDVDAPVTRPKDKQDHNINENQSNSEDSSEDNDYNDYGSREINGGLDMDDENINSLIIPQRPPDHDTIIHGDPNEPINSQNEEEKNMHSHKFPLNKPSEESDQLNLEYEWHKVKVPRIDSNGKVYGWIWKSVRFPVKSKPNSVKWSYWVSRGKKHHSTHWKHKSSLSKIYHHHHSSNNDVSVANFDGWLKKQITNMKNNGNEIPSSDDNINYIKIAIEKALHTNGIEVKSDGLLVDAEGNVLRLDDIQLRPIYIGRSLPYDRIVMNSGTSKNYRIPANTPFLEGLLVSVINPPRALGIVPLGVTALPRENSYQGHNVFLGSGRELHPISIQDGLHKLITGQLEVDQISPRLQPNILVADDSKSLSEEEPEYRIIGGSFAVGSGAPLANKGRSGKD